MKWFHAFQISPKMILYIHPTSILNIIFLRTLDVNTSILDMAENENFANTMAAYIRTLLLSTDVNGKIISA